MVLPKRVEQVLNGKCRRIIIDLNGLGMIPDIVIRWILHLSTAIAYSSSETTVRRKSGQCGQEESHETPESGEVEESPTRNWQVPSKTQL